MSGPSTLRLCFAAMAPALTEAASARLKLQDPGTKHCDSRTVQPEYGIAKVDSLTSPRKHGDHLSDFINKSDDIADLTSHTNNRTPGDTVRSLHNGKGGGLVVTSTLPKHTQNTNNTVNIGRLTGFTANGKHFSSLIEVSEEAKTTSLLNGLKRMNQKQFSKDQFEIGKNHFTISSNSSADKLRILASKVSKSVMVNGDNGLNGKKEEQSGKISCTENGDGPVRKEVRKVISEKSNGSLSVDSSTSFQKASTMGMCVKNKVVLMQNEGKSDYMSTSVSCEIEKPCEEVRKECVKKQAYLERKVEMLLRRLKRVKGKVVESHTKEQLVQYVNFQHRNLQMVAKSIKSEAPCPEVLKEHFLSNEDVKNMSTSQLVKLVRDNQSKKSLAVTDSSAARYRMMNTSAVVMSPLLQAQSLSASERLGNRVQTTENDLDSDATASSSGGESSDEDSALVPNDIVLPPLLRRAEWKWAMDRAAIVARWTWLQAQVSDLEYKIRQQSQVHRQLRSSKGGVVLGDPPTTIDILRQLQGMKPNPEGSTGDGKTQAEGSSGTEVSPYNVSALMSNVDKQASRLTQSLNCLSPASSSIGSPGVSKLSSPRVCGVNDSPSSSVSSEMTETTAENSPLITSTTPIPGISQHQSNSDSHIHIPPVAVDSSCQAARCRPLRSYRKRKILRTMDLYKTSVKAARLSDFRCRCAPPSNPCAMCGGRHNNTLPMDADNMSFNERVALLDPSFHPVLSFPQDIPLSIHCEGLLKSGLWQNKAQAKRSRANDCRRQKAFSYVSEPLRKTQGNNKMQTSRTNSTTPSSSMINFTTKIKNKYEGKTKAKTAMARSTPLNQKANKVKRKAAKMAKALKKKAEEEDDLDALYLEQEISGPASASQSVGRRRRTADNAFDINNIEIPHSIAASTRVEQIQYKEIVTPKWRMLDELPEETTASLETASLETASLETTSLETASLETASLSVGKQLEKTNGVSLSLEQHTSKVATDDATPQEQEVEDLSDEAYLRRHSLPEQEEMKRFRTFLQYPPARRNRARSDAFLSLSDKENVSTPNKQTPSCSDGGDGDASNPGLDEGASGLLNKSLPVYIQPSGEDVVEQMLVGRRRTMSALKRDRTSSGASNDLCAASSNLKASEPWQRRVFPLPEDEYSRMQSESSYSSSNCEPIHRQMDRRLAEPSGKVYVGVGGMDGQEDGTISRQDSRATSPQPSESLSSTGDDQTDPDWLSHLAEPAKSKSNKHYHGNEMLDSNDPDWNGSDTPRKGKKKS